MWALSGYPMPMPILGDRFPFLAAASDEAIDSLLRTGLQEAKEAKKALNESLLRVNVRPSGTSGTRSVHVDPDEPDVTDLTSQTTFDAKLGITTMVGRALLRRTKDQLAPILDPRSWSCSDGVIAAAFLVDDEQGVYKPKQLPKVPLGTSWHTLPEGSRSQLLYEYARSDVASFENILKITEFSVSEDCINVKYQLHDCLVFMLGMLSAPGGLTIDDGHISAERYDEEHWRVEVFKKVQVRDLTPNDPGNRFDFGRSVNSTIGAALSEWVHDTRFLRPVL